MIIINIININRSLRGGVGEGGLRIEGMVVVGGGDVGG